MAFYHIVDSYVQRVMGSKSAPKAVHDVPVPDSDDEQQDPYNNPHVQAALARTQKELADGVPV
jgi:hypothetical protein